MGVTWSGTLVCDECHRYSVAGGRGGGGWAGCKQGEGFSMTLGMLVATASGLGAWLLHMHEQQNSQLVITKHENSVSVMFLILQKICAKKHMQQLCLAAEVDPACQ